MTGKEDARYRLELATRSLGVCDDELVARRWRESALFARAAIEQAMKGILACFGAVPRTHEPGLPLDEALADPRFPGPLRPRALALRPLLDGYGTAEHMMLSYGDETTHRDPWSLVDEPHAREAVRVAHAAVDLARDCVTAVFGS